ncbi:MAG: GFA family protein [Sedimenticola sp.]|nr:GFA family protein [Sedimenticola sp.]
MSSNHQSSYRGQCLCGAVKYEVDKIGPKMAHCHCSMCRRFHGAAFATFGEAHKKDFRWLKGEDLLKSYLAENGTVRRFCSVCGASMTFAPANDTGELVEFTLGTLSDPLELRPDAHIYVGSKADWYAIEDGMPQFEEGRDSKRLA